MPTKRRPPAAAPAKGKRGGNRGGGRPSAYDQGLANDICDALAAGQSLRSILKNPRMPAETTIYAWLRTYDTFAKAYSLARAEQAERYAEEIVDIADTEPNPHKARVKIDARKWAAAKLLPKKYGDRVDVQVGGEMVVRGMTDEQLDSKIDQMMRKMSTAAHLVAAGLVSAGTGLAVMAEVAKQADDGGARGAG